MLPPGVTITSVRQSPSITQGGRAVTQTTYTYTVGDLGPFTFVLVGETDTPATVQATIQKKVSDLAALGLKTQ